MSQFSAPPTIACFGEILWDCLPHGIFLGGAPLNVAYHLSRLGLAPVMISAVGRDFLGDEALRRIDSWGVDCSSITRQKEATGVVRASLDRAGAAHYTFDPRSAWDRISTLKKPRLSAPPAAIVFGTLALRRKPNQQALASLLAAWPEALRVVDLNLRTPFDRSDAIEWALPHASVLKLNTDELARLTSVQRKTPAGWAKAAQQLSLRYKIARICITAGKQGAGLLWDGTWFWSDARPVKVRDTVGAGDAFLAGLLASLLLRNETPPNALASACRLGEFVAAQDGATPAYRCDSRGRPALTPTPL